MTHHTPRRAPIPSPGRSQTRRERPRLPQGGPPRGGTRPFEEPQIHPLGRLAGQAPTGRQLA
eukprot:7863900-Alexandrium_andersonii.AAC.1